MPIQIIPISADDIPGAARCIQKAFKHDPYFQWVFDSAHVKNHHSCLMACQPSESIPNSSEQYNLDRNLSSLTLRCEWGLQNALFYVAKDPDAADAHHVLGVSMWLPPRPASEPESWASFLSDRLLWFRQGLLLIRYLGRGGLILRRYQIWKSNQAQAQKEIWTDPNGYYFCNIVVVDPESQGKGLGRMLMEVITASADREGRRCYLESSRKEPNVAIYEKMGFRVVRRMDCEDGGERCDLYCMVRDPDTPIQQ